MCFFSPISIHISCLFETPSNVVENYELIPSIKPLLPPCVLPPMWGKIPPSKISMETYSKIQRFLVLNIDSYVVSYEFKVFQNPFIRPCKRVILLLLLVQINECDISYVS